MDSARHALDLPHIAQRCLARYRNPHTDRRADDTPSLDAVHRALDGGDTYERNLDFPNRP